jgi:hypothetical protein
MPEQQYKPSEQLAKLNAREVRYTRFGQFLADLALQCSAYGLHASWRFVPRRWRMRITPTRDKLNR